MGELLLLLLLLLLDHREESQWGHPWQHPWQQYLYHHVPLVRSAPVRPVILTMIVFKIMSVFPRMVVFVPPTGVVTIVMIVTMPIIWGGCRRRPLVVTVSTNVPVSPVHGCVPTRKPCPIRMVKQWRMVESIPAPVPSMGIVPP